MAQQLVDRRDLDFVIWEQMDAESLLKNDVYKDFNKKTCDMIITEARNFAIKCGVFDEKVMKLSCFVMSQLTWQASVQV